VSKWEARGKGGMTVRAEKRKRGGCCRGPQAGKRQKKGRLPKDREGIFGKSSISSLGVEGLRRKKVN